MAFVTLLAACSSNVTEAPPLDLWGEWEAAGRGGGYVAPDDEELKLLEALFQRTLQRKEGLSVLKAAWAEHHFDLMTIREENLDFLALRERTEHKTGRGFYLFLAGPAPAVVFQAPHSVFDERTGEIALRLMLEGRAMAAAWSTASRSKADLAHTPGTCFQSFTGAVARTYPKGVIVQLHGFDQGKRKSRAAASADLILSGGVDEPAPWVRKLSERFKKSLPGSVKLYPEEVKDLGGTANAQVELLRGLEHDGFAHVEMSFDLRSRMAQELPVRKAFLECVTAAVADERR